MAGERILPASGRWMGKEKQPTWGENEIDRDRGELPLLGMPTNETDDATLVAFMAGLQREADALNDTRDPTLWKPAAHPSSPSSQRPRSYHLHALESLLESGQGADVELHPAVSPSFSPDAVSTSALAFPPPLAVHARILRHASRIFRPHARLQVPWSAPVTHALATFMYTGKLTLSTALLADVYLAAREAGARPLLYLLRTYPYYALRLTSGEKASHLLGFARVAGDEELEVLAQDYLHRMACHHASSLLITYVPLAWLQARSLRTGAKEFHPLWSSSSHSSSCTRPSLPSSLADKEGNVWLYAMTPQKDASVLLKALLRELGSASRASLKPPSKDGSGREGGRERSDSVFSLLSTTSSVASFASYSSSDVSEEGQGGKEEGREEGREEGKEEVGGDGSEEQDERGGKETQTAEATEVGDGGKVKPKTYYAVRFEEHWTSSLSASPPTASRDDHSGPKHRQDNIRGGFTVLSLVPTPGKVGGREGAAGEEAEEEVVAELEKYLSQTTAPSSLETFPALSSSVSARSQSHQRVLKASLCVVNPPTPLLAHALSAFEKVVVEWESNAILFPHLSLPALEALLVRFLLLPSSSSPLPPAFEIRRINNLGRGGMIEGQRHQPLRLSPTANHSKKEEEWTGLDRKFCKTQTEQNVMEELMQCGIAPDGRGNNYLHHHLRHVSSRDIKRLVRGRAWHSKG
ncbi:hypothetical protein NSK_004683 [Nannochloropsis salina CCMP1776]|uniref:BTB domain-containing protein n=1 Tax=Nannochloropsis salina CCMP1776 TaxID=1027361 RepID=A0A4D9D4L5_9STRA|nr:hypothetical protein NSK_004683 [Nannochloropsis salina CCMP1776]|eukprot:TFJ83578.1 hypothetical protein NSK_004683 [Nannochloropsis salina CCMP1776]